MSAKGMNYGERSESIPGFVELSVNGTIHPGKNMLLPTIGFMY